MPSGVKYVKVKKIQYIKRKYLKSNIFFYLFLFVGFSVLTGFVFLIPGKIMPKSSLISPKAIAQSIISNADFPIPTSTPTPTPTITITPNLTPTPTYFGYCLNTPVLMYHHVMPWGLARQKGQTSLDVDSNIFDQQMGYLATHGFNIIFAQDLITALKSHSSLPSKSIAITLDDGYQDVYDYAFPVLKKYNIKATVMVPTGLLGNNSGTNSYYNWGQLGDMLHSGLVSVGNHTWSHYAMGSSNPQKDQYEVTTAQKQLQQNLGINPLIFAYPYGTNALNTRIHTLLQQDGFEGAFSTIGGSVQCDSFMYALHRTRVGSIPFPAFGIY